MLLGHVVFGSNPISGHVFGCRDSTAQEKQKSYVRQPFLCAGDCGAGAIYVEASNVAFGGVTKFHRNLAESGGELDEVTLAARAVVDNSHIASELFLLLRDYAGLSVALHFMALTSE